MLNLMCTYHIKFFRRDREQPRNPFDTLVDSDDEVEDDARDSAIDEYNNGIYQDMESMGFVLDVLVAVKAKTRVTCLLPK